MTKKIKEKKNQVRRLVEILLITKSVIFIQLNWRLVDLKVGRGRSRIIWSGTTSLRERTAVIGCRRTAEPEQDEFMICVSASSGWRFTSVSLRRKTLTALLVFLHAGAGSVMVAHGAVRRHGAQQRVTWGERRQGAVPHQLFQFTVPGVLEGTVVPGVRANLVKGDGAAVEVQGGRRRHVGRGAALVEVWRAVAKYRLLLDDAGHQIWCADRHGGHWKAVSAGLDLQLLHDKSANQHTSFTLGWEPHQELLLSLRSAWMFSRTSFDANRSEGMRTPKKPMWAVKVTWSALRQPMTDLDSKQQVAVCVLQLSLSALQLLDSLLLPLKHPDVVHRGLQNGPLIPAHVSEVDRRQRSTVRVSWPSDQLTGTAKDSLWPVKPLKRSALRTH